MLAFVAFPALAVLTVWLISRWASLKTLPPYVTVTLFLSFFIPISTVALVPFDLVDDETLDNHARLIVWRLIYWVSFALMWLVIPVLQAYVESGYHAPLDKLKDALRYTLKYHVIILAAGLIGGIYMGVTAGLTITSLKAVCVALSHSYGLVLVIWMLGHGCVDIPRSLWQGTVDSRLAKLYRRAVSVHDNFSDAQTSYDDVVAKIMALEPIKTSRYGDWIDGLVHEIRSQDLPLSRAAAARAQPRDLTPANVASLSRRFHRDLSRTIRARGDWKRLLDDVQYFESLRSRTATEGSAMAMQTYVRPILVRGGAVVLASLSVIVTWSELVSGTRVSLVDIIIRRAPPGLKLLLAALFLGYMCVCVNLSLTSMRIFNLYAIVPKHTDASSLLFFAAYALRLTVPLSYNFLTLNSTQETVFQEFLGKFINLTALGKYFNQVLPRLIVIPIAMAVFNFYDFIKDYLGFGLGLDYFGGSEEDDLENGASTLLAAETEGREIVRRALDGSGSNNEFPVRPQEPLQAPPSDENIVGKFRSWLNI